MKSNQLRHWIHDIRLENNARSPSNRFSISSKSRSNPYPHNNRRKHISQSLRYDISTVAFLAVKQRPEISLKTKNPIPEILSKDTQQQAVQLTCLRAILHAKMK